MKIFTLLFFWTFSQMAFAQGILSEEDRKDLESFVQGSRNQLQSAQSEARGKNQKDATVLYRDAIEKVIINSHKSKLRQELPMRMVLNQALDLTLGVPLENGARSDGLLQNAPNSDLIVVILEDSIQLALDLPDLSCDFFALGKKKLELSESWLAMVIDQDTEYRFMLRSFSHFMDIVGRNENPNHVFAAEELLPVDTVLKEKGHGEVLGPFQEKEIPELRSLLSSLLNSCATKMGLKPREKLNVGAVLRADVPSTIASLAVGSNDEWYETHDNFFCVVLIDGRVQCLGSNRYGSLGDGNKEWESHGNTFHLKPEDAWNKAVTVPNIKDAKAVWAQAYHVIVQEKNGDLWCWGPNNKSQCGRDKDDDEMFRTPVKMKNMPEGVVDVAMAGGATCLRTKNQEFYCLGGSDVFEGLENWAKEFPSGNLGYWVLTESWKAHKIDFGFPVKSVTMKAGITCVTVEQPERDFAFCWGKKEYQVSVPRADGKIKAMAVAPNGLCIVTDKGWVRCEGQEIFEFYRNNQELHKIVNATDIVMGVNHACFLIQDGRVQCIGWPTSEYTLYTRDRRTQSATLVDLKLSEKVEKMAAAGRNTCFLLRGSKIECNSSFRKQDRPWEHEPAEYDFSKILETSKR